MQDPMNSTPIYQKVNDINIQHGSTLFLLQRANDPVAQELLSRLKSVDLENVLILDQMPNLDLAHYLQSVTQRIQRAWAGWQAVILGEESFIWRFESLLVAQGLMKEEMSLISIAGSRQVYCVHCGYLQIQIHSNEDYCHCEQCGVYLLVRSHFSQRLGAYMGVCADADHSQGDAA